MKSQRYLSAVLALPLLSGGTASAVDVLPAVPLQANSVEDSWTQAEAFDAFLDAGYTATQVQELADIWDLTYVDAKAKAGTLILEGDQDIVDTVLDDYARTDVDVGAAAFQAFWDAGYTYDQLIQLTSVWQLGEFDAKAKAGTLILEGDQNIVNEALSSYEATLSAPTSVDVTSPLPFYTDEQLANLTWFVQLVYEAVVSYYDVTTEADATATMAFWNAGYTYDQLIQLTSVWDISKLDAKVKAGTFVLEGDRDIIDDILASASEG